MTEHSDPGFLHLNHDGLWPGFAWDGLEADAEGRLRLRSLPKLRGVLPAEIDGCPANGPAGVAVAADGTIYWSDPERGIVHRTPGCKDPPPIPPEDLRVGGERGRPVALLALEAKATLLIADAEHGRIDRYALPELQWLGSWGEPGSGDGQLDRPSALAADSAGAVYVADTGNARVQKLDRHGAVVPSFWSNLAATTPALGAPLAVAVADVGDGESLWILDDRGVVVVAELDGAWKATIELGLGAASGLLVRPRGLYVGDLARRRLVRFTLDGERIGEAHGYRGPVGGIARLTDDAALVAPGCGLTPLVVDLEGAFIQHGLVWGGPFSDGDLRRHWQRLRPVGDELEDEKVHLQWLFFANDNAAAAPLPPVPSAPLPFAEPPWLALAPDAPDVWIGAEAIHLWLGARIEGDGLTSPTLANLRLERDREGYARHLPAVYQTRTDDLDGLQRFLGLFESIFVDAEEAISTLDRLFDPRSVPFEWLDWLAGWLGVDLDQAWPEDKQRRAIAEAWERHRWRGTARGLRAALRLYAGLDALVEEPLLQSAWWSLAPEGAERDSTVAGASVLGFTTMLAASEPAGAVLGSSAVLDQSRLLSGDEYGESLFEATAHQFSLRLYPRQLSDLEDLDHVRRVVEREKPAHTHYHLCVVEPRLRVGYQARLGIDAVIGGRERHATLLGVDAPEDGGLVLAGPPAGRMGASSRVGLTTRLGALPVERGTECQASERMNHGRTDG